ncbi:MAG: hypothetical protein Q8O40_00645 [Chloroflexota bacterium]|nr:hypothetical protein [Chloroflexota bacterium]
MAADALGGFASSPRRVIVTHWNGVPVLQSYGRELLAGVAGVPAGLPQHGLVPISVPATTSQVVHLPLS